MPPGGDEDERRPWTCACMMTVQVRRGHHIVGTLLVLPVPDVRAGGFLSGPPGRPSRRSPRVLRGARRDRSASPRSGAHGPSDRLLRSPGGRRRALTLCAPLSSLLRAPGRSGRQHDGMSSAHPISERTPVGASAASATVPADDGGPRPGREGGPGRPRAPASYSHCAYQPHRAVLAGRECRSVHGPRRRRRGARPRLSPLERMVGGGALAAADRSPPGCQLKLL